MGFVQSLGLSMWMERIAEEGGMNMEVRGVLFSFDFLLPLRLPSSHASHLSSSAISVRRVCGYRLGGRHSKYLTRFSQELTSISRLKEALEANDWAANDDLLDLDDPGEDGDFGAEVAELEMEMFGMREVIHNGEEEEEMEDDKLCGEGEKENEEDGVEKLEAMMLRMQAVRGEVLLFCSLAHLYSSRSRKLNDKC
jgi:hypothetical protein